MKQQKPFDKNLNDKYDIFGKNIFKEVLEQCKYTNIVIRKDEIGDKDDDSFWDISAINKNNQKLYFDVGVKTYWKKGSLIPKKILKEGFSIENRKSISHNTLQNKVNYIVLISKDGSAIFIVPKKVFETKLVISKYTKFGYDLFRNIPVNDGKLFIKKDNRWQKFQ